MNFFEIESFAHDFLIAVHTNERRAAPRLKKELRTPSFSKNKEKVWNQPMSENKNAKNNQSQNQQSQNAGQNNQQNSQNNSGKNAKNCKDEAKY